MTEPAEIAGVAGRDLSGQTVLVTGSTSGIGREAAVAFGQLGAEVLVHGRDEAAGRAVVGEIERVGGEARFFRADFTDIGAVRRLAREVRTHVAREGADGNLDVLANNAGGYFRTGRLTQLGVEQTFQVNHLAGYLLTAELLPVLGADARVVTTSSAAHRGGSLDEQRLTTVDDYSGFQAYQRSKLANVLFTTELARRFDGAANAFHPGMIPGSGFLRFLPGPVSKLGELAGQLPLLATPADGAATLLYLACGDVSASGRYFEDCAPRTPSNAARNPETARRLWELSAELLDVPEPLADRDESSDLPARE